MTRRLALIVLLLSLSPLAGTSSADTRLLGPWNAVTYTIAGKDYPMKGILIFSEKYYSVNVRFKYSGGQVEDANANSGAYSIKGTTIVFKQLVQLHLRPGDPKDMMLVHEGPDEAATYQIEGNRLTFTFPGGNRYVLERLSDK